MAVVTPANINQSWKEEVVSKVVILTGATATGKTVFADKWVAKKPASRRYAGTLAELLYFIEQGHDVVFDSESFCNHDVTVKHFTYDEGAVHGFEGDR